LNDLNKKEIEMLSIYRPFSFVQANSDSEISPKTYFDRLFEDAFNATFKDISHINNVGIEFGRNESELVAYVDMPGVKESDINIEVSAEGLVTVKAARIRNNSSQEISKSFSISKDYDLETLCAELSDGVLCLKVGAKPPPETKLPRKINVSSKK
jgi:HSP20 family molecular chaperone IbpA